MNIHIYVDIYVDAVTVYPKKYAHGFCFAVLCCGYTLTYFPISIRLTSLALWQSNDCPSASKATLMNMDKYFMWINYQRLHNHNKAKHKKTVCIFLGIYCKCNVSDARGASKMKCLDPFHDTALWIYWENYIICSWYQGRSSIRNMMTSSNGNIFRVTGNLCGEFTGPRWISRIKASDAELWCFPWSASE